MFSIREMEALGVEICFLDFVDLRSLAGTIANLTLFTLISLCSITVHL